VDKDMIKNIRKSYNMTQREFAKTVQCSFALIALVEVGKRRVTDRLEAKVKEAFNLNDEQLASVSTLAEEVGKGITNLL
jgi:transcriptional regulator with XRE-family HTH domain